MVSQQNELGRRRIERLTRIVFYAFGYFNFI